MLTLGARGVCRLCHKQATRVRGANQPLDVIAANRHGQQLYFADMFRSPSTLTQSAPTPSPQATEPTPRTDRREPGRPPWLDQGCEQLRLFTITPDLSHLGRAGLHQRARPEDCWPLEAVAHQVADANKWSSRQRREAIIGIRIMLAIQTQGRAPIRASDVEALRDIDLCVWTVLEVLSAAGALIEDRSPTIDLWFTQCLTGLPEPMSTELRTWFDIMKNGTTTPPRRRPRSHQTITLQLHWALPQLRQWATAGHTSLREISKEHVLDTLPAAGAQRARAGQGLKSIFRLLKGRRVLFLDPTARVATGEHPSNQPIPLDANQVRALLLANDPATALVVALIAFHGIRMGHLQRIQLTDIRDGHLHLPGQTIPLAQPVRERLAAWLDHRSTTWPDTPNSYLFLNRCSAYRSCPVSARWLRLKIGPTITPRQLREDRILSEAHATGGDVRAIADLFGLSITASSRYAYTLEHDDLTVSSRTHTPT